MKDADQLQYSENNSHYLNGHPGHRKQLSKAKQAQISEAVAALVAKFDAAQEWNKVMSQPWAKSDVENMLSNICEHEQQPADLFLPQGDDSLGQTIMRHGGSINDFVGVFFQDNVAHTKPSSGPKERTFPAIVRMAGRRRIEILVSKSLSSVVDEEAMFAAELQVSIRSWIVISC